MLPIRLPHHRQLELFSCQSTALAIIAGALPEDLAMWTAAIHKPYFEEFVETGKIISALGLPLQVPPADNRLILDDHVYLHTVPSLNIPGGFHSIVVVIREGQWAQVIDPGKGWENRRYYVRPGDENDDPLAFTFKGGIVEAYCSIEALYKWQSNNPPLTHPKLLENFTQTIKDMLSMS